MADPDDVSANDPDSTSTEDRDLDAWLWAEFINKLNGPTDTHDHTNVSNTSSSNLVSDNKLLSLFEEEEEGDDPNDPDYNLDKDLQNIKFEDDDFNFDEYLDFFTDTNLAANIVQSSDSGFNSKQLLILQEQLKFHVQTLTQTWMLSSYCSELETINSESKKMLLQLDGILKNEPENEKNDDYSQPNVCLPISNLQPALNLIETRGKEISEAEKRFSFGLISDFSRKLICSNRDIFIFDWAFPIKRLLITPPLTKIKFTLPEDFLIAAALSENSKTIRINNHFCQKIQEKYMPWKSISSISSHIKNAKRPKTNDSNESFSNPLVCYFRGNKLPVISCFENLTSDTYHKCRRTPRWFNLLTSEKDDKNLLIDENDKSTEVIIKKDRLIAPKYDANQHFLQTVAPSYISPLPYSHDSTMATKLEFQTYPMTAVAFPQPDVKINLFNSNTLMTSNVDSKSLSFPKAKNRKRTYKKQPNISHKNKKMCANSKRIDKQQHTNSQNSPDSTSTDHQQNPEFALKTCQSQDGCKSNDKNETTNANSIESKCSNLSNNREGEMIKFDSSILKKAFEQTVLNDVDETKEKINTPPNTISYAEEFAEDEELEVEPEDEDIVDEESELRSFDKISAEEDGDEGHFSSHDNENDLMALMEASWTAVTNRARHSHTADTDSPIGNYVKRKSEAIARKRDFSLFLQKQLTLDQIAEEERQEMLIQYYLKKAQKLLSHDEYIQFLQVLVGLMHPSKESEGMDIEKKETNSLPLTDASQIKTVYAKIKHFLEDLCVTNLKRDGANNCRTSDGIRELIQLLVPFLDFFQAHACGESFDYLYWKRVFDFLRKVELYLTFIYSKRSQQLACIQRLIKSLSQINEPSLLNASTSQETKAKIKSIVSKIVNGHSFLIDEFSSLFLDDSPVRSLYSNSNDFDEFTLVKDNSVPELEFNLETVHLPVGNDLNYGTSKCPCNCHSSSASASENYNHCPSCAIRFIAGRIYIPQYNSCTKKVQLIEYVKNNEHDVVNSSQPKEMFAKPLETTNDRGSQLEVNVTTKPDNCGQQEPSIQWTMAEDRMLLEACRTMILDSHITQLNEQVFDNVARHLIDKFEPPRTCKQLCARLHQLIEMLTSAKGTNSIKVSNQT